MKTPFPFVAQGRRIVPSCGKTVRNQRLVSRKLTREEQIAGFRGWHERGYLPHRDEPGLTQFVTFRLADSFPAELRDQWEKLFQIEDQRERRTQLEAWLDLGYGECHLNDERIAQQVKETLQAADGARCQLMAFTIMPNHLHVLFRTGSVPMAKLLKDWKGSTGRAANQILGRKGMPFWQADYWDTYMRDSEHELETRKYIENNPAKAGLVLDPKTWPWSSARFR
ncbi:MAG: transposase, partial [Prosthecobacter sp.]